jgi:O-antigen ligase
MLQLKSFLTLVKNTPLFNIIVMLILLTYPALLLTVRGSMGVLFGVMLIISVVHLFRIRHTLSIPHWDGYSIAFALAMASPVLAIFLSQAYHRDFNSPPYDWASRFVLAIPIFLMLRQTNFRAISVLQYGLPLGALVGLFVLPFNQLAINHRWPEFSNHIHFGDTALILGFLSLFSINWVKKDHPLVLVLKLCGFVSGVYMSINTESRGGWIAIPILFLLWIAAHNKKDFWLKFVISTLVVMGMLLLSYLKLEIVHARIDSIFSDIHNYVLGNKDTSIGIRFQLYLAATHLFFDNPIFGAGPGGFSQAVTALAASGRLTPDAGILGASEVHNEILLKCAETGIFGLLSILSVYLVPIFIFRHSTKSTTSSVKIAGFMGICLVFGFFIFGLTVETFNLKMTATFFAFTLAVLMAAAMHHEAPETIASLKNIDSGIPNSHISPSETLPSPPKLSRIWHHVGTPFAPLVAVLALTIAVAALSNNQSSHVQLDKATIQIENLSVSLSTTQAELKKLQSEIIQKNAMQDEEQKKQEARISILIQNINALQVKMKIHPTLEEQLLLPTSTVIPGTAK